MVMGVLSESLGDMDVCREPQACDFFVIHRQTRELLENQSVLDFKIKTVF